MRNFLSPVLWRSSPSLGGFLLMSVQVSTQLDSQILICRSPELSLSSLTLCSSLLSNTVPPNSSHTWVSLFLAVSTRLWAPLSLRCSLQTASRGNLGICRAYIVCVTFLSNHSLPLLSVQYMKVIVSFICLCGLLPMAYE